MNKCLRITVLMPQDDTFAQTFIKKQARKYDIEGQAQYGDDGYEIVACGLKTAVDSFVDDLHAHAIKRETIEDILIEPFYKEKDFRGIFRVIL